DLPLGADQLHRDLAPAARGCAQVHHPRALEEKLELLVQLHELEARPGAPPLLLGELVPEVLAALAQPLAAHAASGQAGLRTSPLRRSPLLRRGKRPESPDRRG